LQLLEGIGDIKPDKKKLSRDSYQDSMMLPSAESMKKKNEVPPRKTHWRRVKDDGSDNLHVVLSVIEKVVHIQNIAEL